MWLSFYKPGGGGREINKNVLKAIRIFLSKQNIFTSWRITTVLHVWMTVYIYTLKSERERERERHTYVYRHIGMHIKYSFKNDNLFSCLRVSSYERTR